MKVVLWCLAGALAFGAGVGAYYLVNTFGGSPVSETVSGGDAPVQSAVAVVPTGPIDCGLYSVEEGTLSVSGGEASGTVKQYSQGSDAVKQCFEAKFAACAPAVVHAAIPFFDVEFRYEIASSDANGCTVKGQYTKNPDTVSVGLPATCVFNNKNSFFDVESEKFFDICTGPLIDHIMNP